MFGLWLLSTSILFLINYRSYLPPEINRHIQQGFLLHVAGFFLGSVLAWFAFTRGNMVRTVIVCAVLFFLGAALEVIQLFIAYRYFNLNDVMANGVGIGLFMVCLSVLKSISGERESVKLKRRKA
ncbi:MAG: VanZ family protein [Proteobacteria bacterium]|nr:VanZ family protein [Pseudomonadota bacterium]